MTGSRRIRLRLWGVFFPIFLILSPFIALAMTWSIWSEIMEGQLFEARRMAEWEAEENSK